MNAHVALYYRLLCLKAESERRPLAQLYWYTQAMLEADHEWKPHNPPSITGASETSVTVDALGMHLPLDSYR